MYYSFRGSTSFYVVDLTGLKLSLSFLLIKVIVVVQETLFGVFDKGLPGVRVSRLLVKILIQPFHSGRGFF
jgi:hypothetical protein